MTVPTNNINIRQHCGMSRYLYQLGESFVDKNERNEESKNLLGEGGDVANEKTSFCGHNHQHDDDEPEPDPHSTRQVLKVIHLAELRDEMIQRPGEK